MAIDEEVKVPIGIEDWSLPKQLKEGRPKWGTDIIKQALEAMEHMPKGKSGIVIGSGQNTLWWKGRGWKL